MKLRNISKSAENLNYDTANEPMSVLIEPVSGHFNLRRRSLYYGAMIRWIKTWRCEGKIHHCLSILARFRPSLRYLTCPNRWWYVGGGSKTDLPNTWGLIWEHII